MPAMTVSVSKRRGRPPSGGREAILEAALAVLRSDGIAKLTSRAVAARAGVSDASVYYHFKDRAGLLLAAFAHGMQPLEFLADETAGLEPAALLERAFTALEAFFDEALPIMHAAQSDAEVGAALAEHIAVHDLGPHRGVRLLGDALRAHQNAGTIPTTADADAVALLVIDAAFSRAARRHMLTPDDGDDRLPSPDRLLGTLTELLVPPR
ncbi:TetR/AcrR family transcriptional regulator [Conexibacter sp. DBS9H8]|uniref:TetR/AcrR family transcriptional regulator n=1 Tax=Conexibacter sp. DBS9H8 TaxID=2937801 RepID=UPI00200EAEBC|nr:TetR/AcrR family transcriptional regulator [Conexibacter sp. DBS9H8]